MLTCISTGLRVTVRHADRDNASVSHPSWDASYAGSVPPPWDIGQPQPAFVRLAEQGMLTGQLLDVGCGTGEHTLLAASSGADALGVDVSPLAIEQARGKAAARGIAVAGGRIGTARFEVADALRLEELGLA
jgi:2-polyprenyl-3-methyl-5-hydroxy-6-metoxy-1,4-benzoquinol methylase